MKRKNASKPALGWIWRVPGAEKWNIVILLLAQAILSVSSVAMAWLLRGVIDCAAQGDGQGFCLYTAALAGAAVLQLVLRAFVRFLGEYTTSAIENSFKKRLFSTLLRRDYASITAIHSGEWMNRLTSDTVIVAGGLTHILPGVAGTLTKLLCAVILLLALIPGSGYLLIPGGLILVFLTFAFRVVSKRFHRQVQEADGRLRIFLQERLGSLMIVRAFAREGQTEAEAAQRMSDHRESRMKRNHFSNLCNVGFGAVMQGAYLLCVICCGHQILQGVMSYGTFAAVLQLVGQIQSPFANITGYLPQYYAMLASAERLMEAEALPVDAAEPPVSEAECQRFYRERLTSLGLRGAAFTYQPPVEQATEAQPMPVVLRDLDLEIRKGEYVALLGPSGCGKSTLLKLLMCLYPMDAGTRYLQAADGEQPLTAAWRGLFAYVPQGNHLMAGTIRQTVAFGDLEGMGQEARLRRALRIACAETFVDQLEHGLDSSLGERGAGLSEGQTQRIAIARAVFSDRPILLLDEATSALDEETEALLLTNLRTMTDKTVIIVTHRPAVLSIADTVFDFSEKGGTP